MLIKDPVDINDKLIRAINGILLSTYFSLRIKVKKIRTTDVIKKVYDGTPD